jgi:type I restriction enzyme S subunit
MKRGNVRLTAQQLRNSILQLAIQGKLVSQDPHDESASVLLEKIRKEKQALVRSGKLKEEKPLKAIRDEEIPFDIPASWEWVRLGEIVDFGKSNSILFSQISPESWLLELEDIEKESGRLICKRRKKDVHSISEKHSFIKGNVLYGRLRPYLNKVIIADEDGHCSSEILTFDFKSLNNRYSMYYLMSPFFVGYAMRDAYGVKMPRIGSVQGNAALFPIPPLAEQKRIVTRIEELMPLVDAYDKAEQKLTALNTAFPDLLKKAVLQDAVQGKLVLQNPHDEPTDVLLEKVRKEKQSLVKSGKIKKEKPLNPITNKEFPFDIPTSWKWVRLRDLTWLIGDGLHGTPMFDDLGDYYFINGNNLDITKHKICFYDSTKRINEIEYNRYYTELNIQSVLLSINGTIGNIAFYDNEKVILGKSVAYINLLKNINKEYIAMFLKSKMAWNYFKEKHTGTTIKNLGLAALRDCPVPFPPMVEQKRIVAKIDDLFAAIEGIERVAKRQT